MQPPSRLSHDRDLVVGVVHPPADCIKRKIKLDCEARGKRPRREAGAAPFGTFAVALTSTRPRDNRDQKLAFSSFTASRANGAASWLQAALACYRADACGRENAKFFPARFGARGSV
jgi:hypothetical protein